MKAKEVLNILKISRPTLSKYVKEGIIRVKKLPNGFYDYNKEDVFRFLRRGVPRKNVIYARVSTTAQRKSLGNQVDTIRQFCNRNGITIQDIYKDIGSGLNFDRKEFQRLLDDIMNYEIEKIYITYKDRLTRISYRMFEQLFDKFGTEIVVLNEIDDEKLIEKEIFEEIISLIHSLTMKVYSKRRKEKLKLIEKDLKLEISNEIS